MPSRMYTRDSMQPILLLLCACALARAPIDCSFYGTCPVPQQYSTSQTWGEYLYDWYERIVHCHTMRREFPSRWQCLFGYVPSEQCVASDSSQCELRDEQDAPSDDEESDELVESFEPYQEPKIVTIDEIPRTYPAGTGSHTRTI